MKKIICFAIALIMIVSPTTVLAKEKKTETTIEKTTTAIDYEKCAQLLEEYAPIIWYSKYETIYPASIEQMYKCAKIKNNNVVYTKSWSKLKGNLSTAKNYAFYCQVDENTIELTYLQYYMSDPGKFMILSHYGDWEHCTIIFTKVGEEYQPTTFSFNHHGIKTEVSWDSDDLKKDGNHPVVFAARGSHGIYLNEGIHQYRTCLFDSTNSGKKWVTENCLESYYYDYEVSVGLVSISGVDHTYEFENIVYWGQSFNSPEGPITTEYLD